jgi:hypothetical protein
MVVSFRWESGSFSGSPHGEIGYAVRVSVSVRAAAVQRVCDVVHVGDEASLGRLDRRSRDAVDSRHRGGARVGRASDPARAVEGDASSGLTGVNPRHRREGVGVEAVQALLVRAVRGGSSCPLGEDLGTLTEGDELAEAEEDVLVAGEPTVRQASSTIARASHASAATSAPIRGCWPWSVLSAAAFER